MESADTCSYVVVSPNEVERIRPIGSRERRIGIELLAKRGHLGPVLGQRAIDTAQHDKLIKRNISGDASVASGLPDHVTQRESRANDTAIVRAPGGGQGLQI